MSENQNTEKKNEKYPVEFPSRSNQSKNSPIVDVTENEIYPLGFDRAQRNSGSFNSVTEVIAADIEADTEEQTTHGQQI